MSQVLIRELDPRVVASLKRKAENAELSLEAYLRETLKREAGPSRAEIVAEIEALRKGVRPPAQGEPLAADLVRELRDERSKQQAKLHGLAE